MLKKYRFLKYFLVIVILILVAEGFYYWKFIYPFKKLSKQIKLSVSVDKEKKAEAKIEERGLKLGESTKKQRSNKIFSTVGVIAQVEDDVFFLVTPEETLRVKASGLTEFSQALDPVCDSQNSTDCSRSIFDSSKEVVLKEGNQAIARLKQENGNYLGLELTLID